MLLEEIKYRAKLLDFVDLKTEETIYRYYKKEKEDKANENIPPDVIYGSNYNENLDLACIYIDIIKLNLYRHELANKDFDDLTIQALKYINEYHHPHTTIIITPTSCEVLEGIKAHNTDEFIKD